MTDLVTNEVREKTLWLQRELAKLPQVAMPTFHHFANGMYARELHIPAGTMVVGKIHKQEHFFILASGEMSITTDMGSTRIQGPMVCAGTPGTKRAVHTHTDCVVINVHKTDLTDIDAIEKEVIEPEEDQPLLDAFNCVKDQLWLGDS